MAGLIGRKLGMTQVYSDNGELVPVTVVSAGPCPVVSLKTEKANGYAAVQLGFEEVKPRKVTKPVAGQFDRGGIKPHRVLREFRVSADPEFEVGQVLNVSQFEVGEKVKITGTSKGKGFAGVVKRYHFRGKKTTHGTPDRVRHPGAIGQGTTPGKVWKGKKMPGHMGHETVTLREVSVVRIDEDRNLILVKGPLPGAADGFLLIRKV